MNMQESRNPSPQDSEPPVYLIMTPTKLRQQLALEVGGRIPAKGRPGMNQAMVLLLGKLLGDAGTSQYVVDFIYLSAGVSGVKVRRLNDPESIASVKRGVSSILGRAILKLSCNLARYASDDFPRDQALVRIERVGSARRVFWYASYLDRIRVFFRGEKDATLVEPDRADLWRLVSSFAPSIGRLLSQRTPRQNTLS